MRPAVVRHRISDVMARLAELGIPLDMLQQAVLIVESARDSCTPHDPLNAPGFNAWQLTIRSLRDLLVPAGWTSEEDQGLSVVVRPDGRLAIAVTSGDEGTGQLLRQPRTKHARGPATAVAVHQNGQMNLFGVSGEENPRSVDARIPLRETYFLLRRRWDSMMESCVFSELSLPTFIGEDGQIRWWGERLILPTIPLGPPTGSERPDEGDDDIDVPVTRRR